MFVFVSVFMPMSMFMFMLVIPFTLSTESTRRGVPVVVVVVVIVLVLFRSDPTGTGRRSPASVACKLCKWALCASLRDKDGGCGCGGSLGGGKDALLGFGLEGAAWLWPLVSGRGSGRGESANSEEGIDTWGTIPRRLSDEMLGRWPDPARDRDVLMRGVGVDEDEDKTCRGVWVCARA